MDGEHGGDRGVPYGGGRDRRDGDDRGNQFRGKTLLPGLLADVHVSILPESSILPLMEAALSTFAADPPRNVSFLSGPSKTADIEQTLTTGADGPKTAIALLL